MQLDDVAVGELVGAADSLAFELARLSPKHGVLQTPDQVLVHMRRSQFITVLIAYFQAAAIRESTGRLVSQNPSNPDFRL